jgi:type IV pilus assembly protein PilO
LQVLGLLVLAALVLGGLYLGVLRPIDDHNHVDKQKLEARRIELNELRKYEHNMPAMSSEIANLKQQLEIQRHIVPDEEEADQFIHLMQNTAQGAGIEIRRWTAKPVVSRDFYAEAPFDLELDGPYYSMLNFFDKVAGLERIINISGLQLASTKAPNKLGHNYEYAPQETVVAICTATTFFSHAKAAPPSQ